VCAGLDLTADLTAADPARAGDGRVVRRLDTCLELGGELVVLLLLRRAPLLLEEVVHVARGAAAACARWVGG
jgi:hypothetical protein